MGTPLKAMLEKQWSSTHCDTEVQQFEYILTQSEEEIVVRNKIDELKKGFKWRLLDKGAKEGDVVKKMAEINWEEKFDRKLLLEEANKRKHFDIQNKELIKAEKEKRKKEFEELKLQCDANYMFNLLSKTSFHKYNKKILYTDDTSRLIKVVCFFLSNDKRFESELGYSLNKGLWLRGISGLGKTYLLTCLKDNLIKPINIYSMVDIYQTVKDEGGFKIDYSKLVYIDDVGTEENPVVKNFGTEINFFKDFIEGYYIKSIRFDRLIVSTNNNFVEIEEKYGSRVRSRLKDMFNIIDVTGQDLRG